jgi:L-lactate dehydrogenase complex protein LldG
MSSREKILKEIANNKPSLVPLPHLDFEKDVQDFVQNYLEVLHSIGGKGKLVDGWNEVQLFLQQKITEGLQVANAIAHLAPYNIDAFSAKSRDEIKSVHTVFLEGGVAVAENAAIWVTEGSMGNRMLPFICEELVLVIDEQNIVASMHDAYSKISTNQDGYGVFIAGPSKTADIEQSLVIGAHGPLSLQVFVLAQ